MVNVVERVIAALVCACLFCLFTVKTVGIMQQVGYKNKGFWRWLKRKDNLYFNRLSVLALCLALSTAVVALCFSFLEGAWATLLSALPFLGLLFFFGYADNKYALKVPAKRTGRYRRLFGVYFFFTALFAYVFISLLSFLAEVNGSKLYATVAYVPFALTLLLLPALLALANAVTGVFEEAHNRKFVKRAGQVLDESKITRIAVVGSYGKTSVKNILKTLLAEKYAVVETPASYNTPVGIAKTVFSQEFEGKEIFIAEMGARKKGDIQELCALVKPDYVLFTGVCEQHIASFGSLDAILEEKSQALRCGAKAAVCGESLRGKIPENEGVIFADTSKLQNLTLGKRTKFSLYLRERIDVETTLLGRTAAEDILLAATLCEALGLTAQEIAAGIAKLQPVPHRLQLLENNGIYILDDGYNCNIEGAKAALEVLSHFEGKRCVVTPGIVEGGILEEGLNGALGEALASYDFEQVILVGETLVSVVKEGYLAAGGKKEKLTLLPTLTAAGERLGGWLTQGDAALFLNDLPDAY